MCSIDLWRVYAKLLMNFGSENKQLWTQWWWFAVRCEALFFVVALPKACSIMALHVGLHSRQQIHSASCKSFHSSNVCYSTAFASFCCIWRFKTALNSVDILSYNWLWCNFHFGPKLKLWTSLGWFAWIITGKTRKHDGSTMICSFLFAPHFHPFS